MLVVAIDVGIKNLGLCVYDFECNQVIHWDNVSLVHTGRYIPANNVQYVRAFLHKYNAYFERAHAVLVERQMRCNMRIIEAIFQSLFFDRCQIINPRSVKLHYSLSSRNYRTNKALAVEWAQDFMLSNPQAFAEGVTKAFKGKCDDMADSLLLVMYYLDTYSHQLSVG